MPAVAVFWIDAEDHDWDEVKSVRRPRRRPGPAHDRRSATRQGAHAGPGGARPAGRVGRRRARRSSRPTLPATEFTPALLDTLRAHLPAGRRHGRRLRPLARIGARAARADRVRRRRTRRPSRCVARRLRARDRARRRDVAAGGRGRRGAAGARLPRAGHAARRQRRALPPRTAAASRSASRTACSSGATATATTAELLGARAARPAGVQPERAAAAARAGHAVSHGLLRGRPQRAGLSRPARRRLRGVRHPDAARSSSAPPPRCSTPTPCDSSRRHDFPLESLRAQDEAALNQLLEAQLPPRRRGRRSRTPPAWSRNGWRRWRPPSLRSTRRSRGRRARRWGGCRTI